MQTENVKSKQIIIYKNKLSIRPLVGKIKGMAPWLKKLKPVRKNLLFYCTAGLITVASIIYYGFIASDVYISEAKFLVRSSEKNKSPPFGNAFEQMGVSDAQRDSWIVHDYMLSKDVVNKLNTILDIKNAYSNKDIDVFNRFPGLRFWDHSMEMFHLYYQNQVTVTIDPISSVTTLSVRSFKPEIALQMNKKLLAFSEELINKLNERARYDLIKIAQNETTTVTKNIYDISAKLSALRSETNLSDPEGQALSLQRIVLERELANQQLAIALAALQKAKTEALKKQLYIVKISIPEQPEIAMEPRRIRGVISMMLLGLIIWGLLSLIISSVKEHYA